MRGAGGGEAGRRGEHDRATHTAPTDPSAFSARCPTEVGALGACAAQELAHRVERGLREEAQEALARIEPLERRCHQLQRACEVVQEERLRLGRVLATAVEPIPALEQQLSHALAEKRHLEQQLLYISSSVQALSRTSHPPHHPLDALLNPAAMLNPTPMLGHGFSPAWSFLPHHAQAPPPPPPPPPQAPPVTAPTPHAPRPPPETPSPALAAALHTINTGDPLSPHLPPFSARHVSPAASMARAATTDEGRTCFSLAPPIFSPPPAAPAAQQPP